MIDQVPRLDDPIDFDDTDEQDDSDAATRPRGLPAPLRALAERLPIPNIGMPAIPLPVLVGVGSGVGVLLIVLLVATMLRGGGTSSPAATPAPSAGAPVVVGDSSHGSDQPIAPIADNEHGVAHLPTPVGPSPTATPVRWEQQGTGWIGYGVGVGERRDLLLFDDRRDEFTIETSFTILTASGPFAPFFGIALSYHDHENLTMLEMFSEEGPPKLRLWTAENGQAGMVGQPVEIPGLSFWGRDTHNLRIVQNQGEIRVWIDGRPLAPFENKHVASGGQKGVWVAFNSRIRVDTFEVH